MLACMSPEAKARLPTVREELTVTNILEMMEEIFIDKSKSRETDLREVAKRSRCTANVWSSNP